MYSIHFLVCIFAVLIFQTHCDDIADEPPATNDQLFGKGMTCSFSFEGYTFEAIVEEQYPQAKFLGVGHLPEHRPDFLPSGYMTAVPDKDEEIWGIAYIVSKEDYQKNSATDKEGHSVVKSIEVKVNDKPLKVDCNLGIANNQPEKVTPLPEDRRPTQYTKNHLINACVKYAFPLPYCDKLRNIPAKDC